MTWWVLTSQQNTPGFTHLRVKAATNIADHLYMSWAFHRPRQEEIWKTTRGKRIYCGYRYVWDTPTTIPQVQPGDTLFHSFYISGLPTSSTIWYYLHAPGGPYEREIQGPLTRVDLLQPAAWSLRVFFASRAKGMFRTADFSGPGGPHPHWVPDNAGLPSLAITQACSDPWDPYHRRFVIVQHNVYRMDNTFIDDPSTATLVLSLAQALTLTGAPGGRIFWIAGNENYLDHFYVFFTATIATVGFWCLKTKDAGASWTAHQIDPALLNYTVGNIQVGNARGESAHAPGDVLYAATVKAAGGQLHVRRSTDEGETWHATFSPPPSGSIWRPRLHIHPADQSILYVGATMGGPDLYRSINHGDSWAQCDNFHALGVTLQPLVNYGVVGTLSWDPDFIRVLDNNHLWDSDTFGVAWTNYGPTGYPVRHMHFREQAFDFLYLARLDDAPAPPPPDARHVIFASTDQGTTMFGKAGAHADQHDGNGDSIPFDCGGVADDGILTLP